MRKLDRIYRERREIGQYNFCGIKKCSVKAITFYLDIIYETLRCFFEACKS